MRRLPVLLPAIVVALLATAPAQAQTASVFDGRIACETQESGLRVCAGSTATRVASFDGMPLDVNVVLPAHDAEGGHPLIVLLHGWGGSKSGVGTMEDWAKRGYAVLSNSARGWGGSCSASSRLDAECARPGTHNRLADTRYEVRDVQYLAGMLADEGVADPRRIGVTGGSYGGGQSMALAALRNRVMLPDGSYARWTSPQKGLAMRIAAAAPEVPWTDLAYSLMPNGRTLDYVTDSPYGDRIGVQKTTYVAGLFATGLATSQYAPPGTDPGADLITWYAATSSGDPYDPNPLSRTIVDEITAHHSSYYIDDSVKPAPLLIANGWTDDLFPVDEALRFYNRTRTNYRRARIGLQFLDYGHARGQGKAADVALLRARIRAFMDRYLKGDDDTDVFMGVEVTTQTCGPDDPPGGGPYRAPTWAKLAPGEVRHRAEGSQVVTSTPGDPEAARAFDPIAGGGACATAPDRDAPGTAVHRLDAIAEGEAFTLLGSPTVIADITAPVPGSQIAARLLDVAPDGTETLVARGIYRPDASGRQVFQLHPNGWRFEAGHQPKLELLGTDAPYGRPGNIPFAVTVADLELRLPTLERPGSGRVTKPAPRFLPSGRRLMRDYRLARRRR